MPFSSNNMLGLVIVSLGVLGVIVSFLITERRKYLTALALSGLIIATGVWQYVGAGIRQWKMTRRIEKLQEQQRMNLQALQDRLRQGQGGQNQGENRQAPPAPATKK